MARNGVDNRWQSALILLAAAGLVLAINPVGFVGGGQDDGRYLEAAQCWAANGPCLPRNHWDGRWPVFAPIAILIRWLGESRWSVQLWPLLSSAGAILLLFHVARRHVAPSVAMLGALLLLATPAFSI